MALIEEVLPKMAFEDASGFLIASEDGGQHECAVCLGEMQSSELVRVLPCVHCFHATCIDKWLRKVAACPTCKSAMALG